jgi:hypothetical protein
VSGRAVVRTGVSSFVFRPTRGTFFPIPFFLSSRSNCLGIGTRWEAATCQWGCQLRSMDISCHSSMSSFFFFFPLFFFSFPLVPSPCFYPKSWGGGRIGVSDEDRQIVVERRLEQGVFLVSGWAADKSGSENISLCCIRVSSTL